MLFILSLFLTCSIFAADKTVPEKILDVSVTVLVPLQEGGIAQGSGIEINKKDKNGDYITYILSASHVIAGARKERIIVSSEGFNKTLVYFTPIKVFKLLIEDNRQIGKVEMEAVCIKFSDPVFDEDLCILKVLKKNFSTNSVQFYKERKLPPIGTKIFNLGSAAGEFGASSLLTGYVSNIGKILNGKPFIVLDIGSIGGCSGSSICLDNGDIIGILTMKMRDANIAYAVGMDRISKWMKTENIEWLLDSNELSPTDEELAKIPLEDGHKHLK